MLFESGRLIEQRKRSRGEDTECSAGNLVRLYDYSKDGQRVGSDVDKCDSIADPGAL